MALKISLRNLISEQLKVYTNEDGKPLLGDKVLFFLLPIILGILSVVFLNRSFQEILFLYQSIAFLSGFMFSALIVVLNISAILVERQSNRMTAAGIKTIKEIAITSLSVFVVGVLVTAMGMIEATIGLDKISFRGFKIVRLWHGIVVGLVAFIILNLMLVSKKLVGCMDDIIER